MKVVEILHGEVHHIYPEYGSASEARKHYAPNIVFVDAPDDVFEGCTYKDGVFSRPELEEGWAWDDTTSPPTAYNVLGRREEERTRLHAETTNDTLQALRKIREGDTSIDWQAWLDALDAYNVAIEETKNQEGYPLRVEYPDYPTKP